MQGHVSVLPRADLWAVHTEGGGGDRSLHAVKEDALRDGRALAKQFRTEFVIKGRDGRIQDRDSYGNGPIRRAIEFISQGGTRHGSTTRRGLIEGSTRDPRHEARSGGWRVKTAGAKRATVVKRTQKAAEAAAKRQMRKAVGGEVRIHGRNGRIRDSDTVKPGRESRARDTRH